MKYKHYEYIGTKIGMPLYYCMEENKFYLHDFKVVKSSWMTAATVLLSSILYPLFKKWNDQGLHYKKIVLHEWALNLICFEFRIFGLIVLLVYPFMLREQRNFLFLVGYPLFWFLITFAFASISIRKRIIMLIRIHKIYIKRQTD